ncbi:MAG TPA: CinA family nicotinamide mononucleotide deamidase-related protein [Lacipirellulaceae bacterium]|jgi:nicotinamide-nucleotide amidase|nr:CinA family nicotinamide mononucleotide deamidase-related protein [Lacipirellulaceae bacterium]
MRAEIISIGDELTSGQRLDTNSQWLSQRLNEIGIPVAFHTTVGDDLDRNVEVFQAAVARADIVVSTGGLGPTADDLTRDAIAAAAGVELVEDAGALEHIKNLFARRKREMPERNKLQAQFPRGSRVIPNPEGTAPGIDLSVPRPDSTPCRVIALPGVPAELFTMWKETVGPALSAMQPEPRVICHRRIKCFGVGESDLEAMLPDMIRRKREPLVGITVHGATITLRITASGANEAECRKAMQPTAEEIFRLLGVLVFGEEDDELEHAVVRLLAERSQTLAVAEWATDGLVSQWLAEGAMDNECIRAGIVIHEQGALTSLLKIDAAEYDRSSAETATAMARAIQRLTRATYGLGIAAFPTAGTPVATAAAGHTLDMSGTLQVALATADNVRAKAFPIATHPSITKVRSAKQALNMVRLAILNRETQQENIVRR